MTTPFAMREDLINLLQRDLLGPADGPEEELSPLERQVTRRYLVGMLAPGGRVPAPDRNGNAPAPEDDDDTPDSSELQMDTLATAGSDDPDSVTEREPVLVDSLLPSSAGLSFLVDSAEEALLVRTGWGRYEQRDREDATNVDPKGHRAQVWKRQPVTPEAVRLPLREGDGRRPLAAESQIELTWRIRRRESWWHVTLFLVNAAPRKHVRDDSFWIFQPELRVESADGQRRPILVQQQAAEWQRQNLDPDERTEMEGLELRYRHCRIFGKGHGCAVRTLREESDPPERARMLEIDFLPVAHVPGQTPRTEEDDAGLRGICLDMHELAHMSKDTLLENLRRITAAYDVWVESLPGQVREAAHAQSAEEAQADARRALRRMEEGIAVLEADDAALRAFRFTNQAMHYQRVHSIYARRVHGAQIDPRTRTQWLTECNIPRNRSWRLFQLAFIISNIPTLADPLHPERSGEAHETVAELLWFATGGGKTEAYLGLTAFTLALRRLYPQLGGLDAGHGVGVFMRYTLRLLTLQQFQRAAALMCACEMLRRKDPKTWGKEPFRLGLWVGSRSTPNRLESAARQLSSGNSAAHSGYGSPLQFSTCPWCGAPITEKNMSVRQGTSRADRCLTFCGDNSGQCSFAQKNSPQEGLPVMVVDEEIYRHPPALLISTVDKFAQMPWKGETAMLFGRVSGLCPRHGFVSPDVDESVGTWHRKYNDMPEAVISAHSWLRPPDLIIQDELHLISGPLGSMTALYENAVDALCCWQLDGRTVRPRVIASTATIRRAAEQVRRLFDRRVEVFPPPGVDSRDNFFSLERPVSEQCPGRVYVGICSIGQRIPPTTVRLYATIMAAAQSLFEQYGVDADPWMTTVGYFNSVRELAGARRLIEDQVRSRLADPRQRSGLARRRISRTEELTSRQASHKIPGILERLGNCFESAGCKGEAEDKAQRPYDVVLATNMISVGVDVERLGLMIMLGQPKTTSEYIQASSRVGRSSRAPGLVLTLYNWARPRDLSHFEDFYGYHAAFQRHVEALSVTPFAGRALDRGLAGVLVSLVRLLSLELNGNTSAKDMPRQEALFQRACAMLLQRAEEIAQDVAVVNQMRDMLDNLRDAWLKQIRQCKTVGLAYSVTSTAAGLLKQPDRTQEPFACPNSLRDVEKTVNLVLETDGTGLSCGKE
ncbi:MAG TPA: helicase [Candidatus Avidesulfovibrio excrementigallinarum]|nr:helicase [Candidatus Avidesulfovibrio excrementigallinarum]